MNTLETATNLKDNKINGIKFYNQTEEPVDAGPGDFWFDKTAGTMKAFGTSGFDQLSNIPDGLAFGSAGTLQELGQIYSSGIKDLYVKIDNNIIKLRVNFDTDFGPSIMLAFNFEIGGVTAQDKSVFMNSANDDGTNGPLQGSDRYNDEFNLSNIGNGSQAVKNTFINEMTNTQDGSKNYGDYGLYGPFEITYYNFATEALLSSDEKRILQNWVSHLSPSTPLTGVEMDADHDDSGTAWDSQDLPSGTAAGTQEIYVADNDDLIQRITISGNSDDEHGTIYTYTENTFNKALIGGGGWKTDNTVNNDADIPGLLSTKLIMPEKIWFFSTTGGGNMMGTIYNHTLDNKVGNRTYFLIK